MPTSKVVYIGKLRTENHHVKSGNTYITDAPTDNRGKGEAFSPTDTVATGLVNCMLTTMGIKAQDMGVTMDGSWAELTKIMASNPRRIARIEIEMHLPADLDEKSRKILENTARTCPVELSLHPDIERDLQLIWDL